MSATTALRRCLLPLLIAAASGAFGCRATEPASPAVGAAAAIERNSAPSLPPERDRPASGGFELLGLAVLPTGFGFEGTEVGGLSAIAYEASFDGDDDDGDDGSSDRFLALSDDRAEHGPARLYALQVAIDRAGREVSRGALRVAALAPLTDRGGAPFAAGAIDPEGLALAPDGRRFVSSEGDTAHGLDPFVREIDAAGRFVRELAVPAYYLASPGGRQGIRPNLGFEPLTVTPDGARLITGTENALFQDGPKATLEHGSPSRLLLFDLASDEPVAEYLYWTEPVAERPLTDDGFRTNGLVELLALGDGRLLALERSFSMGRGFVVRLFLVELAGADNLAGQARIEQPDAVRAVAKRPLLDLGTLGLVLDNFEGMAFGPTLADGRRTLVLISDNNFNPLQSTQLLVLAVNPSVLAPAAISAETGSCR
jgi:hypothetical protein